MWGCVGRGRGVGALWKVWRGARGGEMEGSCGMGGVPRKEGGTWGRGHLQSGPLAAPSFLKHGWNHINASLSFCGLGIKA